MIRSQYVAVVAALLALSCEPRPAGPSSAAGHEARSVVYQQGVSGYRGATDRQKTEGLVGAGTILRAEAKHDISDVPPQTTKAVSKLAADRTVSARERTARITAMVPPRPVTTSFTVLYRLQGIPAGAGVERAALRLAVANIREPSVLHYESAGTGDTTRLLKLSPGDREAVLDVTEATRTALRRRTPLSVRVTAGKGGAWFYGVRHRRLEARPRLTIEFDGPVVLAVKPHRNPLPPQHVAKETMVDEAALAGLLEKRPRLRAAKLYPCADAPVGSRGDPKGTYAGHAHVDTNFGSSLALGVRDWYPGFDWRSLVRFDLKPLAGRRIHGAVLGLLTLSCPNSLPEKVKAYALEDEFDDWGEDTVTWRSQPPAPCHYNVPGLDHQMVGPSKDPSTVGRWYHWEVSGYIEDEIERGNGVASLVMKEEYTGSHSLPIFASREAGPAKSPYLLVVYEGPEVKASRPAITRPELLIARDAGMILDFEAEGGFRAHDMKKAPLETAERGATGGRRALQAVFEEANGGIYIELDEPVDLTTHGWFCFDVTWHGQSESGFGFAALVDDPDSGGKWEKNWHNEKLGLVPGRNTIRVPTKAIGYMNVDPTRAKKLHLYWTKAAGVRPEKAELSFDSFRLEGRKQ